jgi:hypothetical protein
VSRKSSIHVHFGHSLFLAKLLPNLSDLVANPPSMVEIRVVTITTSSSNTKRDCARSRGAIE